MTRSFGGQERARFLRETGESVAVTFTGRSEREANPWNPRLLEN